MKRISTFNSQMMMTALADAFKKLNPRLQVKNPVMFMVFVGAIVSTGVLVTEPFSGFVFQITIWLWFTVLFANFAEAVAEGRGKAQANALKKSRSQTTARRLAHGMEEKVPATDLQKDDLVICEVGI